MTSKKSVIHHLISNPKIGWTSAGPRIIPSCFRLWPWVMSFLFQNPAGYITCKTTIEMVLRERVCMSWQRPHAYHFRLTSQIIKNGIWDSGSKWMGRGPYNTSMPCDSSKVKILTRFVLISTLTVLICCSCFWFF